MDLDSFCPGHEPEHIVPEHGMAALGHLVVQSLEVTCVKYKDVIRGMSVTPVGRPCLDPFRLGLPCRLDGFRGDSVPVEDVVLHIVHIDIPVSHRCVERIEGVIFQPFQQFSDDIVRKLQLPVLQAPSQKLLALRRFLIFLLIELLLDAVARLGGHDEIQPV